MDIHSQITTTLYAQLMDLLVHATVPKRGISLFTRSVDGSEYWYLQYVIGDTKRSFSIGPDTEAIRSRVARLESLWADEDTKTIRKSLVSMLVKNDINLMSATHARVIEAVAQAGVFLGGGVLVGSHAFGLIGNMLGVTWGPSLMQTSDIDIGTDFRVVVPNEIVWEDVLTDVDAFLPVPSLNRKHASTTFKIRGQDLSVSLLTPMFGKERGDPVLISGLQAAATPLRFLDYLLEETEDAALLVREGALVRVPNPARFALHKLVVSQRRPLAFAAKSKKDVRQAEMILGVLLDFRPVEIESALEAAREMPKKFSTQLKAGLRLTNEDVRLRVAAL